MVKSLDALQANARKMGLYTAESPFGVFSVGDKAKLCAAQLHHRVKLGVPICHRYALWHKGVEHSSPITVKSLNPLQANARKMGL
jgi:hypothetical protein